MRGGLSTGLHLLLLVAMALPLACSGWRGVRPVQVDVPDAYLDPVEAGVHSGGCWWPALGDSALDVLMDEAFRGNLTLRQAVARLDQYLALRRTARASFYPSLSVQASATESDVLEEGDTDAVVLPGGRQSHRDHAGGHAVHRPTA